MKTKTIKLQKNEYTNFTTEFDDHDIIIFTGARGAGKSYPVAKHISHILETNPTAKFAYMRINNSELATYRGWCNDLNLAKIAESTDYKLTRGTPTSGDIMLTGYDLDGKVITERIIGKCISLEQSALIKSDNFNDFEAVVFEEYIRLKMNPDLEKRYVFNFMENIVSIFRDRPKKIYVLGNSLKTIPLFDNWVDEMTGELLYNPLKIKIFREGNNKTNKFLAYLNGDIYNDDEFKVNLSEFLVLYTNKKYIINQHKVYSNKHYIQYNNSNKHIIYNGAEYLRLKYFCTGSSNNEFYYQNSNVEKAFNADYPSVISEIANFAAEKGEYYIV